MDELYRQLFNPALYLLAYGRIYANKGALTPGVDEQTADGMSVSVITRIVEDVRQERYRFTPVRRVHIPKKKGGTRPLGVRRGQTNSFKKWCACWWRRRTIVLAAILLLPAVADLGRSVAQQLAAA